MSLDVKSIAADILRLREATPPKIVFNALADTSLSTAYVVQTETAKLRFKRGETQIGYKVGCTSGPIQTQMGIHEPIYGRLFAQDRRMSPQSIDRNEFDGIAIEGELAVELDCDPRDLPTSHTEIKRAISRVFPVIELHHFGDPRDALNASVLVANNAIHAGFVQPRTYGIPITTNSGNLSIRFDDVEVASVAFKGLKDTVLHSLSWLRDILTTQEQISQLTPPVTVLCGSVAPLIRISERTKISVSFNGPEIVRCDAK